MTGGEVARVVRTNAGMCAVWQPEAFHFDEFVEWEDWATENQRLLESITEGTFIPVNVGGDGVFGVVVRWNASAALTAREEEYLVVSSEPYLFECRGSFAMGGLEEVGNDSLASSSPIPLASGRYAVTVFLIDWKADSRSVDALGKPTDTALPDLVVLFNKEATGPFRTRLETFDRP
jgi:hypothetical protein